MTLITNHRLFQAILRTDFGAFNRKVFDTLHSGETYEHNWHIDAKTQVLSRVIKGQDKRLLITQPPRTLKSITTSVAWPAWIMGHYPSKSFICISYSQDLATDLSEKYRRVVESRWYQELFPGTRFTKLTQTDAQTDRGGRRRATSIGGTLTGIGGDIIIIDDPLKADEAYSEVSRKAVIDWFTGTLQTRLNNQKTSAMIIVMQRLHEEDLAGYILSPGKRSTGVEDLSGNERGSEGDPDGSIPSTPWAHLNLPAIAMEAERIPIGNGRYHIRKEGDLLHEARLGHAELARLKRDQGSQRFSAQFQQNPVPIDGNMIKRDWLIDYKPLELVRLKAKPVARIVQSWDVAMSTSDTSDYSVCTTWLKLQNDYYLMDVLRAKLNFPDLKRQVVSHALKYGARTVLIEKTGLGLSLVQDLSEDTTPGFPRPIGIKVKEDKIVRMEAQSAKIEAGQMHIPQDAPWRADYIHELMGFPFAKHDDQVDSTSQFLKWASEGPGFMPPAGPILIHA
ncbi:MAG: phage terminase large subunit [Alphaproteobacteria bacterium]